ncbi:MAG: DJ-1/PfpI family protein [Kangiellaceae bacterium]|nr:DJ-1/PfpI family protein [Kangiellaceae bacterium]MCW9018600.1 DJ-1/PfpI family protein [Kangiellaceae bacterium]
MTTNSDSKYNIVIPVYDGVDLMDVTAPYEVFSWLKSKCLKSKDREQEFNVIITAEQNKTIISRDNFKMLPDMDFDEFNRNELFSNLIWIPGGSPEALIKMQNNHQYMEFIKRQSATAEYVTSVCEGALLLAYAGLLDGYTVTTHWAFIPCLQEYPEIKVADGYPRYVQDRNRITGGGISSGLDESIAIVKLLVGEAIAEEIQLSMQYFPDPPVQASIPKVVKGCPLD